MSTNLQRLLDFDGEQGFKEHYFMKIEALFAALRGRGLLLSPNDYQLAFGWFERRIPLSCVLRGIRDAYFKKLAESDDDDDSVRSLSFCRWAVSREWKEYKAIETSEPLEEEGARERSGEEVSSILDSLMFDLRRAAGIAYKGGNETFAQSLADFAVSLDELRSRSDTEEVESRLRELDLELLELAETAVEGEELKKAERSVDRKLKPHRDSMDAGAFEATRRSALRTKLRMNLALPVLTLYSI